MNCYFGDKKSRLTGKLLKVEFSNLHMHSCRLWIFDELNGTIQKRVERVNRNEILLGLEKTATVGPSFNFQKVLTREGKIGFISIKLFKELKKNRKQ